MPSHFLGIYVVLYDYTPQSEQELALKEGDLLYVLEKSTEDDWWKAKKRTLFTDEEEPEGLVPCNYIEEAKPIGKAKATYDYTRQTQEEISFTEDTVLDVYDTQDPDWTLVGFNGEYGFAPANYIEMVTDAPVEASPAPEPASPAAPAAPAAISVPPASLTLPPRTRSPSAQAPPSPGLAPPDLEKPLPTPHDDDSDGPPPPTPPRPVSMVGSSSAANRLSTVPQQPPANHGHSPSSNNSRSPHMQQRTRFSGHYSDSDSDDDGPHLPVKRPPHERRHKQGHHSDRLHPVEPGSPSHIPPGYRTFPVQELIGKKKHAALLALGPERIILIPDKSTLPRQEWSIENLLNYSFEDKHVFIDVNYPTKAMDLHAGSKEGAQEIFAALGEINGAARAAGLREVLDAAEPKYKRSDTIGTVLWDFVAGGQDEVSVAAGDEVTILDDKDADWWLVKRTVNGQEGVVPSSYIERGRTDIAPSIDGLRKEKSKSDHARVGSSASLPSGVQLPVRTTSLAGKRDSRAGDQSAPAKTKPDPSKLRTWTDRSGTFKVEAQFLGYKDGKIHLHKSNGVKIAVPVGKMSVEDLDYVERRTGVSLEDHKPLSYFKTQQGQQSQKKQPEPQRQPQQQQKPASGITIEKSLRPEGQKNEYDWFDFFLGCGIDLANCQRYAHNFQKENMDETFLPDLTAASMRNLGMKEGDILRAVKFLDNKYGRNNGSDSGKKAVSFGGAEVIPESEGGSGGLFSGPGGVLKNNTSRKGRPAPAVVTSDTVDPSAFLKSTSPPPAGTGKSSASGSTGGFDDAAWEVKPSKQAAPPPKEPTPPPAPAPAPALESAPAAPAQAAPPAAPQVPPAPVSAALQDLSQLSLSTPPLQPTVVNQPPPPQPQPVPQPPQPQPPAISQPPQQQISPQLTGFNPSMNQQFHPSNPTFAASQRQRPTAPQQVGTGNSLIPPPPQRPISAPQTYQSNNMGVLPPITPHLTGLPLTSAAPPGQLSMAEQLHEMRLQQIAQQQQSLQQTQAAIIAQMTGMAAKPLLPMATAFQPPPQQSSGFVNGLPTIQAPQPTMPGPSFPGLINQPTSISQSGLVNQPTGMGMAMGGFQQNRPVTLPVNSLLPPPLVPTQTGVTNQGAMQPLKPQPTGPPPPVRFGVTPGQSKLTPQPTGKRANLSQATPDNPFGF